MTSLFLLIFILTFWCCFGDLLVSPKIYGGIPASYGQFPFMVSIGFGRPSTTHFCGGALLNNQWVLTAAHCTRDFKPSDGLTVYLGGISLSDFDKGEIIPIDRIIIHPEYNTSSTIYVINDLSLLKMNRAIKFTSNIKPVNLVGKNQETETGSAATIMGWGYEESGQESDILLYTQMEIISDEECYDLNNQETGPMNICIGSNNAKSQCTGDSGGPVIVDSELVGIISWSNKPCGIETNPGTSTQISYYIDWINQYINS